ncbi:response regulator [Nocardioides panacisoli]|nr:response regulator [Nocardioides panacisoli]QYJ05831.1 response regulator [Nocardioides panacisoli]
MPRLLVVEDDTELARTLRISLSARQYDVEVAGTGAEAIAIAERRPVDLVVLDLGLPDMDGGAVIDRLRLSSGVPIVVLSARDGQDDKVTALDSGADDYLTKPFGMDELLARLRAALRRGAPPDVPSVVETESFRLDLAAKTARGPRGEVRLTPTEWHLVEVLVRTPGTLVTQRDLLAEVWGPVYQRETNYLRVYLAQLRRKLEADPSRPRHLITEPGLGYRFDP